MASRNKPSESRKPWWLTGAVAIGLLVYAIFRLTYNPLIAHSEKALNATFDSDADRLYGLMHDEEQAAIKVSKEQWRIIFKQYIAPFVNIAKPVKVKDRYTDDHGESWGHVSQDVQLKRGPVMSLMFNTFSTEAGPMTSISSSLFGFAHRAEYYQQAKTPNDEELLRWLAYVARRDGPKLTELGMPGVYVGRKRALQTWSQIAEDMDSSVVSRPANVAK